MLIIIITINIIIIIILFLFIPHRKTIKNSLRKKYSDIRFRPDSSSDIRYYPVPAGF